MRGMFVLLVVLFTGCQSGPKNACQLFHVMFESSINGMSCDSDLVRLIVLNRISIGSSMTDVQNSLKLLSKQYPESTEIEIENTGRMWLSISYRGNHPDLNVITIGFEFDEMGDLSDVISFQYAYLFNSF
jgi:hypothetical protein